MEEEKCCGDCCWFCGEETDGWGICALQKGGLDSVNCTDMCQDDFVSRREMRHHMAVLLREKRWQVRTGDFDSGKISIPPQKEDVIRAIGFAYRYMKVFSKLY